MRPFYRKLIAFVAVGFLLHLALVGLTLRAASIYKNGAAIMCEKKRLWARQSLTFESGKPSVIFTGNSIMLSGMIPEVFDRELSGQVKSYNFALPSLGIGPAYFVLEDLIHRGTPPTYVVMPVISQAGTTDNLFDFYGTQGMGFPAEFMSYLIYRKDKAVIFNYLSPMRIYTHELLKYLTSSILNRSNISITRAKNERIIDQMFIDRGYYYIREEAASSDGKLPPGYAIDPHADLRPFKAPHFDIESDPYVKKFFELARENHIHVLLIDSIVRQGTQPPYAERPDMYSILVSRYPNIVTTDTSWQRKFLSNEYFSDLTHLNPQGATLFTQMIAKEFKQAFLPIQKSQ